MVRRSRPVLVRLSWCALFALLDTPQRAHAQTPPADAPAPSGWRARPVRLGTVSLGGQALYSTLVGGGSGEVAVGNEAPTFARQFNSGIGVGFNLRYRTSQDAALAVTFEGQNYNVKVESDSAAGRDKLQFIFTTLDYIKYSATRSRMPRYWTIGAGLAQTRITDNDDEKEYPGDGGVFKLGAGVEYWGWRTLSLELGVRYHGMLLRSKLNHDVSLGLGFNFYTSP
jgi:opacity protein-like surface antigen